MINIRNIVNETILKFRGHIGYSIRPTEQRKGYNKINLYLGLGIAKEFGLKKVMLCCEADNIGSNKTIQDLGGILETSEIDQSDNTLTNEYWIDVEESINRYKDIYEKYIELIISNKVK